MKRTVVIDVGSGNVPNVLRSCSYVGAETVCLQDPQGIRAEDCLILPGVGHFDTVASQVYDAGWDAVIRDFVKADGRFLGICVGHQLMANRSEEGNSRGLGLIDANVVDLRKHVLGVKVPHMGWNSIEWQNDFMNFDAGFTYFCAYLCYTSYAARLVSCYYVIWWF